MVYYVDKSGTKEVGGYVKQYGNLMQFVVQGAGHFVPGDQPDTSRQMLRDLYVMGKFNCNAENPEDCDIKESTCSFMNDCSGHGTCNDHGYCECSEGYHGGDCSIKPELAEDVDSFEIKPRSWRHFYFNSKNKRDVKFSGSTLRMYAKKGKIDNSHFMKSKNFL